MNWKKLSVLFILLVCSLIYINTLLNGFALDDKAVITENHYTQMGFAGIKDLVTHDHFYGYNNAVTGLYRPVPLVTHAVEYQFFGRNAFVGHLVNLMLYILVCIALFYLFINMFPGYNLLFPLLAVLLFAVHPQHTELVANIKGRDDLLNLLFLSLSVMLFIKYVRHSSWLHYIFALVFYMLALFTKESALTFLAVTPLTLWFFSDAKYKKLLIVFSGMILAVAVYLPVRTHFLDSSSVYRLLDAYHQYCSSRADRLATSTASLLDYLKLLVFPYPLLYDYSYNQIPVINWVNPKTLVSVTIYLALTVYALLTFRRKNLLSYCIITYYLTISLSANLITPNQAVFSERFLFLPTFVFSVAAAWLILKLFKVSLQKNFKINSLALPRRLGLFAVTGSVIIAFSFLTIQRNTTWKDDFTLFSTDLRYLQNNARAHYNLGVWYTTRIPAELSVSDTSYSLKAIRCYERTVEIDPGYSEAYFIAGSLWYNLHRYNEAIAAFTRAAKTATIQTPPQHSAALANKYAGKAWFNLGLDAFNKSDFRVSMSDFKQTLAVDSSNYDAIRNIGACYYNLRKPDSSAIYYKEFLRIKPGEADAWHVLGLTFLNRKQAGEAVKCFREAVKLDPARKQSYKAMGVNL